MRLSGSHEATEQQEDPLILIQSYLVHKARVPLFRQS